ncbi:MAG TPA: PKD domain-containing protein [Chitinophagales bacterium]|nr:PKD domain-containing protein [Chitinophagales bacterium]
MKKNFLLQRSFYLHVSFSKQLRVAGLITALVLSCSTVFAQKQTWQWYFGYNASMEFSTGVPVVTNNSAMSQWEGCASIADADGDLLFYTDGLSVWNKNHTVMPNGTGLLGDPSSTQSALIIPKPASNTIYYIFTTNGSTAYYSELDLTLQGGLGDITANKNILVSSNSAEKLAGVRAGSGDDIWVATHQNGTTMFQAYLVTSAGVNLTAINSSVGNTLVGGIGQLQFSPDGKRAAMASYSSPNNETVELFDFDNSTGIFSNHIGLSTSYFQTYGLEFAPNSQILYSGANPDNQIHQWDLSSGVQATILASNTIVGSDASTVGSFQLAPDGKIYVAKESTGYLGVINNPDSLGMGCDYVSLAVSLSPQSVGLGLPNFLASFFSMIKVENTCFGDSTHFFITNADGDSIVSWDFGDPASGAANTGSGPDVYHVFTTADTFLVTIIEYLYGGTVDTTYMSVLISNMPVVELGNDTILCLGDVFILDAGNAGANYAWSNGGNTQTISVTDSGSYSVIVSVGGCKNIDSIILSFIDCTQLPQPGISAPDPTICEKFCMDFTDQSTNNPTAWLWTFEGGNPSTSTLQNPTQICYNLPGTYDVTLTASNAFGSLTQTFPNYITVYATPPAPTINQSGLTLYSSFATSYQWQFNSVDILNAIYQSYTVTQSGYYTVVVYDSHGCFNYSTVYVLISGVDNPIGGANFFISPNPSNGTFMVEWINGLIAGDISIDVVNAIGQIVFSSSESQSIGSGADWKKEINLGDVASGVYFIEIKTKDISLRKKIVVE